MTKTFVIFILLSLMSHASFAQQLDSVQINNEWRYVYPENEPIQFEFNYYKFFDLTYEEYLIWLEWKRGNDPRADLKIKALRNEIHAERYNRKETDDSIPEKYDPDYKKKFRSYTKAQLDNEFHLLYEFNYAKLDQVPPLVQHLPAGKYILYYAPFATAANRSKAEVIEHRVGCMFELLNDELQNDFTRLAPNGDTLMMGNFDQGLRTGVWKEYNSNIYNNSLRIPADYSVKTEYTTYQAGIKNGLFTRVVNGETIKTEHYLNARKVGITTSINGPDSTVFDEISAVYQYVKYPPLEKIHGYSPYTVADFDKLAVLPDNYYLRRIQPALFGGISTDSGIKYKKVNNSSDNDSINKADFDVYNFPLFETYYKVYDKKTKQLIFECYLDTNTTSFSGASWYANGKLFDTIWTNPKTKKLERNIFDLNGRMIYSTIFEIKSSDEKIINGFRAIPVYSKKDEIREYKLRTVTTRNDTIFNSMLWTVDGKPEYENYTLVKGRSRVTVNYLEDNRYHLEKENSDKTVTRIYSEGDIRLEYTKGMAWDSPVNELKIYYKDEAYEGPVTFQLTGKSGLEITKKGLKLSAKSVSPERNGSRYSYSQDPDQMLMDFVELAAIHLLNMGRSEFELKSFRGTVKNHQLSGLTTLTDQFSNKVEFNYSNGLPTGNMEIYSRPNEYNVTGYSAHNKVDSACHFSAEKSTKVYMSKRYTLSNGLLDGPMFFYSGDNDNEMIGVIPFTNGLKQGKGFNYTGSQCIIQEEFYNDTIIGTFIVKALSNGKYDTTMYAVYGAHGVLLNGFTRRNFQNSKTNELGLWITDFQNTGDGTIVYENTILGKTTDRGWIGKNFEIIKKETFENGLLAFSEEFTNRTSYSNFDLLELGKGHDLSINGISWNLESMKNWNYESKNTPSVVNTNLQTHYIRKYFTNGVVSREGEYKGRYSYEEKKTGTWKVNNYDGSKLYELNYFDSVVKIGNQEWNIIGIQTNFDSLGKVVSTRYVLSEKATYECSSSDYYTERQYIILTSGNPSAMNGWNKNYYDNGTLMNEGKVVNGFPEGLWKFYTPDGKLSRLGVYLEGKENGKWLEGDLGEKAYIGEVCIDPNDPKYEFTLHQLEISKDVTVVIYNKGKEIKRSYYDSDNGPMYKSMGVSF